MNIIEKLREWYDKLLEVKNLKIKIIIIIITILTLSNIILYNQLNEYKNRPTYFPYHNPIFTNFALDYHINSIEEYKEWIAATEQQEKWQRNISLDEQYQKYTWEWCQMLDLNYDLMLALMYHESRFDVNAYSRTNDIGLMQINKNNKEWVNQLFNRKADLYDPWDNIVAGLLIYKHYQGYWAERGFTGAILNQYALNSYNMGITGYGKVNYVSRSYDRRIQDTAKEFKSE